MRYSICFLLSLVPWLAEAQESRQSELVAYVGRDVSAMGVSEKEAFITLFRSVSENDKALPPFGEDNWEFVPQSLYEFADPAFRFFVEIAPGFGHPGFCGLRIHIFDDGWKPVRVDAFSTGYRQRITGVYKAKSIMLDTEVLVVKTVYATLPEVMPNDKQTEAPQFRLQFYAIVDGSLMLVRIEDDQGKLILNSYSDWTVPAIGMNYPKGTTQELCELLSSGPDPQRLALLAWVTGDHMNSDIKRVEGVSQEPVESSQAYEELTRSPKFEETVRDLRLCEIDWIREYAEKIQFGE